MSALLAMCHSDSKYYGGYYVSLTTFRHAHCYTLIKSACRTTFSSALVYGTIISGWANVVHSS